MPDQRYASYMICTSPRSGSTLLCKLLAATGRSGLPDSHFHTPSISRWLEVYGVSKADTGSDREALRAVFTAAWDHGTGNTGMFGLRMQRESFDYFIVQIALLHPEAKSDFDRIQAQFGQTLFVHLTRPNKLDQAISLIKAAQTGLWHKAADGTELERASAHQEPTYDAGAISQKIAELTALDDAWQDWFHQQDLQPLRISYEDLSRDPAAILGVVLKELGLDGSIAAGITPPTAKLSDTTNRDWAMRFLSEAANRQDQ